MLQGNPGLKLLLPLRFILDACAFAPDASVSRSTDLSTSIVTWSGLESCYSLPANRFAGRLSLSGTWAFAADFWAGPGPTDAYNIGLAHALPLMPMQRS